MCAGGGPAAEHRAVMLPPRPHRPGILLSVEQLILSEQAVASCVLQGVSLQVDELLDHLTPTRLARPEGCRESVDLHVVAAEVVETGIALARPSRASRVEPAPVSAHRLT